MRTLKLLFLWRFLKARLRETGGKYESAISLLETPAPPRYEALAATYRARLIALERGPDPGLAELAKLSAGRWYVKPRNDEELYVKTYCDYLRHALKGEALFRDHKRDELLSMTVDGIYRNSLRVT